MSFLRNILSILLILPLLVASSCSSDDPDMPDLPSESEVAGYLQLAVNVSGTSAYSRSNPTGGENGDGFEHGRGKENIVYNLSVFVYRDYGQGLDGEYPFVWKKDVTNQEIVEANPNHPYDQIYNVKIPLSEEEIGKFRIMTGTNMRAVVVANSFEDLTKSYTSTKNLREDQGYGGAWTGDNPTVADRFVMSTAFNGAKHYSQDGKISVTGSPTDDGVIYACQVNLERVAARIDLQVTTDNIGDGENGLLYNVNGTGHTVRLTNVIPVNLMNHSSYLIKHVSSKVGTVDEIRNDCLIAGDEKLNGSFIPTNYVITPDFFNKPISSPYSWFTNPSSDLRQKTDDELKLMSPLNSDLLGTAYKFDGAAETDRTIVLTYANENTCHSTIQEIPKDGSHHPSDYLTGLFFRAQYHPAKVYTTGEVGETADSRVYYDGQDFWMYRRLAVEGVNEAGNLYFATENALNSYVEANAKDLIEGVDYRTEKYTGGICYYNVWLKHANVDNVDNIPMMYGIVRNNIYRLQLRFSNIGLPTPEILEPHRTIDYIIDVVPWIFGAKVHIPME